MGRTRAKAEPITGVTVTYDLFDLPTAQHKAGLAGLILQIHSMEERAQKGGPPAPDAIPRVEALGPTSATVTFNAATAQGLFDDLYDSQIVEVAVRSRWQGQAPKREEEVEEQAEDGEPRRTSRFIYDVTQPSAHFLRGKIRDGKGAWVKLWRDMLWAIPRGIPQTRIPFEQRASGMPCKEGKDAWGDLVKVEKARRAGGFCTKEVGSALWLGAQAANAEAVPFAGRTEQNLLLHFWPLTALIFRPQRIDAEGAGDFVGYVLAIPEVSDLALFLIDYPEMLGRLGDEMRGYVPADAVIDLPAQGALEFLEQLACLAQQKAGRGEIRYSVGSIEFLHLVKLGNNVKSMAAGRVVPRPNLLERYEAIVGVPGRPPPYRNPFFRRGLMLALLDDRAWYEPMAATLSERPWPIFIRSEQSPRKLPWYWQDASNKFGGESLNHNDELEDWRSMSASDPATAGRPPRTPLPLLIHRLVRNYVNRRTEERSGVKWDDFKDAKEKDEKTGKERVAVPDAYREAREKIASGAFLEMRSRREQAFVDHFTATFCSVRQFLPEDDFRVVAEALLTQPDDVKTLTLLALSANS